LLTFRAGLASSLFSNPVLRSAASGAPVAYPYRTGCERYVAGPYGGQALFLSLVVLRSGRFL
jgi:hypothetical protein